MISIEEVDNESQDIYWYRTTDPVWPKEVSTDLVKAGKQFLIEVIVKNEIDQNRLAGLMEAALDRGKLEFIHESVEAFVEKAFRDIKRSVCSNKNYDLYEKSGFFLNYTETILTMASRHSRGCL